MLAFVNIGLVPDGGSSLFVPGARRVRARDRDGDARRAGAAPEGARVGPDQPRRRPTTPSRPRSTRSPSASPNGPTRSYAGSKRQLNAWLYERMDAQLELEAAVQQESARPRTSWRACMAFLEKRLPPFDGGGSDRQFRRQLAPYTPPPHAQAAPHPRPGRRPARARSAAPAAANAGTIFPEPGGSPNADKIYTLYLLIFVLALDRLHRRGGRADLGADQVPRPQGPRGGPDPRQHAPGDRLDGRAPVILVFITVFTFIMLPGIKNPPPPTSTRTATRSPRPTRSTPRRTSPRRRRAARA